MGIRGYFRDLRDRLGHIENKNDDAIERLVHIEDKENELRERLIHIEQKADDLLNRNTETNTSNSTTKPGNLSYAQYGEDVLIYNVFKELGIKHPSYIDVGAHDPYIISNTAYFHEHGSRGINIEANPNLFKKFPEERPDDVNINCGAGKEEGEMSFYMIDEYSGRNSFIKENVEQFVAANPEFKIQEVRKIKIRPLNVLMKEGLEQLNEKLQNVANTGLSQQIGGGTTLDYMSIDIEGLEYDALSTVNLKQDGPKVLTIEIGPNQSHHEELIKMINDAGYFLYLKIHSNHTFIRNEYYDALMK